MEDLIRRSDAVAILEDLQKDHLQFCLIPFRQAIERVQALPSADRPQGDTVSRRYLLAEIDDLADEFSEVDENGLHSERWCGIVDAKLIIMNAPSVSDRPQGEWIECKEPPSTGRNVFIAYGTDDMKSVCIGHYEHDMQLWYEDKNFFAKPIYDAMYWCEIPQFPARMKGADDEDN